MKVRELIKCLLDEDMEDEVWIRAGDDVVVVDGVQPPRHAIFNAGSITLALDCEVIRP